MTPSAHENSTMVKFTATTPTTLTNSVQSPDHFKTPYVTYTPTGKDLNISVQKLQPNTVNIDKIPANNDQTMHLSEARPEEDSINSDVDSLTKPNPYNTDMRDRIIKYAIGIKCVKDRCTTPMIVEFISPLKAGHNTVNIAAIHCKLFAAIEILESSLKLITQTSKSMNIRKIFPL